VRPLLRRFAGLENVLKAPDLDVVHEHC